MVLVKVQDTPATFPYKQLGDLTLYIDVYPPTTAIDSSGPVPAVVFFHGGGMTAGDRTSWLPKWLCSPYSNSFPPAYILTDRVHS
jgi:acetyl esterase/lipase